MSYAKQMLDTYPGVSSIDTGILAGAIDAISDCLQACVADADSDLKERAADLVKCIRLCLDCADVCGATLAVTSRQTEYDAAITKLQLEACVAVCKTCGDECERHAKIHAHCRVCAEACRRCEEACRKLLDAMTGE
jgi:hypothetical protein